MTSFLFGDKHHFLECSFQGPPAEGAVEGVLITCPRLIARARLLDEALGLERGHGILQVTLAAILGDIAAGDYERILCGWSFKQGEAWAEAVLDQLRCHWAEQDAAAARSLR